MTTEIFEELQSKMKDEDLLKLIEDKLRLLCKTGGKSLTMTVPPRTDDFDMLICELIKRYKNILNSADKN